MKLLGSTKSKITIYENGENVPCLDITDVELVHCKIINNDYEQDSRVLYSYIPNKPFGQSLYFCKGLTQNFHLLKCGLLIRVLIS